MEISNKHYMNVVNGYKGKQGREFFLEYLVKYYSWKNGVEIGVWKGRTYKHLITSCPKLMLTGIDPYVPQPNNPGPEKWIRGEHNHDWDHEKYFNDIEKFRKKHYETAFFIRDFSINSAKMFHDKVLDFIFIDGDHSEKGVREDIEAWMPKIKENGWILGHDIDWPDVRRVVDELLPEWAKGPDNVWGRPKNLS